MSIIGAIPKITQEAYYMDKEKPQGRMDKFLAGKGFYIVLALCVVIIGASVWMMLSSESGQNVSVDPGITLENKHPAIKTDDEQQNTDSQPPVVEDEGINGEVTETGVFSNGESFSEPESWVMPVDGEIERSYTMQELAYDETMSDWRTHDGVDIAAQQGSQVRAAAAGTVESVKNDDLYGTTVVIDHGNGVKTTYSSLEASPAVKEGDRVEAGQVIGAVGNTAICETAQASHMHFSVSRDGASADPMNYLPQ